MSDSLALSDTVTRPAGAGRRTGYLLVFVSALVWSFGGTIGRFIQAPDSWTIVFWRSLWACLFLILFMLWRDGARGALKAFRTMGLPGLAVSVCFTISMTCFVVALGHTTVANILLMMAGIPLLAALFAWVAFREPVSGETRLAIAAVMVGMGVMVSESLSGTVSPIGDGLAMAIPVAMAIATVITRRYAHVRMTPATCLATIFAATLAASLASTFSVSASDMGFLCLFGAVNLGLGLACFAMGVRLIPAAMGALLGTFEPILGPIWVWLVHGEVPSQRTIVGGSIVVVALLVHIVRELRREAAPAPP